MKTLLARLTPEALDGDLILLSSPASALAMARDHAAEIADIAGRIRGKRVRVEIIERTGPSLHHDEADNEDPRRGTAAPGEDDPESHPLVQQTAEILGLKVHRVERRR